MSTVNADKLEHIDFAWIKARAKELKCRVTDLLVLAPKNDPFYVGTLGDIAQAEWFAGIWARGGFRFGAHLRRIHYWCTSQVGLLQANGKPYENTEESWADLNQASKAARYLDLVSIADIADHKNPDPIIQADYSGGGHVGWSVTPPDLSDPSIYIQGFNVCDYQPYHLEVFIEKSSMNDVLVPICESYNANLQTGEGEMSIPAVFKLVDRIKKANRPARIFYISDFDPAGKSIPRAVARKLEWMLRQQSLDLDVKLCPLVLTLEQVVQYRLPRIPIKESEKRGAAFEERYGQGAVELDALEALHPGVLAQIVSQALDPYYSYESARHVRETEWRLRQAIQQKVDEITARYSEEIQALEAMREELENIEITGDFKPAPPVEGTAVEDSKDWLFDSARSYFDQLRAYEQHKNGDES